MQEIKVKRKSTLIEYKDNKEYEAFTGGKIYYASKHERIKNCYVIRDNYLNPKIITERTLNTCFDFICYMEDIDHMENKSTITYKESEHNGKYNKYIYKDNKPVAYDKDGEITLFNIKLTAEELKQVMFILSC